MSQELNILRCSSCKTYQVHIVKKAKKWQCKICNLKQLFRQIYFRGSGKDCRLLVQKLNLAREHENQQDKSFDEHDDTNNNSFDNCPEPKKLKVTENKWLKYLDTSKEVHFDSFKDSNNQTTSFEKSDDSVYVDDWNAMFGCSQNEYADINNDSSHESNSKEEEHSNNAIEETLEDVSCSDDNNKDNNHNRNITETTSIKNIFDDNEDFDLAIDF